MALDPSIALGVKPVEIQNPLNAFAQMSQIQNYQRQNELANRAIEQEDALNRAYAASLDKTTGQIDANLLRQNVAGANLGSKLPAIEKSLLDTRKTRGEVEAKEFELKIQKANKAIKDFASFNSREEILADLKRNVDLGNIDATKARQIESSLPQNPAELPAWQLRTLRGILDAKDQLEQNFTSQDNNGVIRVIATPKYAGGGGAQVVPGSQMTKVLSPAEIATNAREQQRIQLEKDRIANAENPKAVVRQTVASDGTVTNFNKFGDVVSTVKGVGKPSATYEKTEAQKKTMGRDLDLAISELDTITKDGGLIDQSTGSYIGKAVDIGARAFGTATAGDVAAGKLAPIADLALKMVPRFEGPQSNADTTSYKQAAGQLADTTLPAKIRKEAGKEVLRLMKARKNQFVTQDMASGNTAVPSGIAPPEGFVPDPQ